MFFYVEDDSVSQKKVPAIPDDATQRNIVQQMSKYIVEFAPRLPLGPKLMYPTGPGVCVIFEGDDPIYACAAENVAGKVRSLLRTPTSPLRKALGEELYSGVLGGFNADSKKVFSKEIESRLNFFMSQSMSVAVQPLGIGRKEVEEFIVRQYRPFYNPGVKNGKRPVRNVLTPFQLPSSLL